MVEPGPDKWVRALFGRKMSSSFSWYRSAGAIRKARTDIFIRIKRFLEDDRS
jgi:hypothetical protein